MHIRCPHCRNPIEVVNDNELNEVHCPSCDSNFSLVGTDETQEHVPQTNRRIAHFEFIVRLGRGAFGTVWKARDTELDREVAIKGPRKGQLAHEEAEKFLREARAAAQLKHPGIGRMGEVGRLPLPGLEPHLTNDNKRSLPVLTKLFQTVNNSLNFVSLGGI